MASNHHDFIIVGAGPAGLQAALFLQGKGQDYLMLEKKEDVGSHWAKFPRHRRLISINKKYTGSKNPDFKLRHDWNSLLTEGENETLFTSYTDDLYPTADDLLQYMKDVFNKYLPKTKFGVHISKISKDASGKFLLQSQCESYTCNYLLMGTGGTPWIPQIPDIETEGIDYYHNVSLDKKEFIDKRVLIIGKGNSAFECGEHLADSAAVIHFVSPKHINFAWNSHFVGDLRAVRNNILDMYQLKSQHAILNATITGIQYDTSTDHPFKVSFDFTYTPEDPCSVMHYDRIIACTGFKYVNLDLFDLETVPVKIDPRKECKGKFPLINHLWQFEGIPNMFAIGASMQTVNFRKNAGGFIHGFRYTIRTLIDIILEKEKSIPLPCSSISNCSEAVITKTLERINNASSLYQMYAELCDVIVESSNEDNTIEYYYDIPYGYITERFRGRKTIVLFFNFGNRNGEDAFTFISKATPLHPEESAFLHPIIQSLGIDGTVEDEIHLLENLETKWSLSDSGIKKLQKILEKSFSHKIPALT